MHFSGVKVFMPPLSYTIVCHYSSLRWPVYWLFWLFCLAALWNVLKNMKVRLLSYNILYGSVPWITENPCLIASELAGPPPIFDEQQATPFKAEKPQRVSKEEEIPDAPILKPLTSLKWPYIPDQPSSYEQGMTPSRFNCTNIKLWVCVTNCSLSACSMLIRYS